MGVRRLRYMPFTIAIMGSLTVSAFAGSFIEVAATANIWGAGHDSPPGDGGGGGGILPRMIELPPGTNRTMNVIEVTGEIDYGPCCPPNGPDGIESDCIGGNSWDGHVGPMNTERGRYLAGVFLDDSEPMDPAPKPIDFEADLSFNELSPDINQGFFIGDGLTGLGTGDGEVQVFHIPDDATRVFFGFYDANGCLNPPGFYGDNSGGLDATIIIEGELCPPDFDNSGAVDVADLLQLLGAWGSCADCVEDLDNSGATDVADLLQLLGAWGPCP
jgi:hypothetical protein